jgi:hypothetical protein
MSAPKPIAKGSKVTCFDHSWTVAGVFAKHVRIERKDEDGNLVFKCPSLERIVEVTNRPLATPEAANTPEPEEQEETQVEEQVEEQELATA